MNAVFAPGELPEIPAGWILVPPGDAGLTRRVKAAGPTWTVQERKGRKVFSHGVYADGATVARVLAELAAERATPAYARKTATAARRRETTQQQYIDEFTVAVRNYLAFAPAHADLADKLATAVAAHATPVGSGTVARTKRISVEQRAAAAVIAWMRHQTTAYDRMTIPRAKGERREVRRMLARRSKELLDRYRRDAIVIDEICPLAEALQRGRLQP